MIDARAFTADAAAAHRRLAIDIAARVTEVPALAAWIAEQHQRARDAQRTQLGAAEFRAQLVDQAAAGWVLAVCLVRFLEDNALVAEPLVSGPGDRDSRARDALTLHFRAHPEHSEREYLLHVFAELGRLPGLGDLLGGDHLLLSELPPSADGAKDLVAFYRARDPQTNALRHDFTDPARGTRFLGDLYQDLSPAARKRYALLQTPDFIERFILDRTLEAAVAERGLEHTTLIDPACGSGHFLLGAFARLMGHWREREPHTEPRRLAQRALDAIAGVDINPVAVAIARFRLLIAALSAAGARELREAPDFRIHLAAADALLAGPHGDQLRIAFHLPGEDGAAADAILERRYACVVANPPYITPKDPAANAAYRARYATCHRQYSLAVPFTERAFELAAAETASDGPGHVGMITANSFMKREFGTKLVNDYLPRRDLTHVIDTSFAYIPGHSTPTVILLARNRRPREETVRCALGIRGEPATPADPARGLVWSAIVAQIDDPGSESDFISVVDLPRARLVGHPWSLGGGGAAEVKEIIEHSATALLEGRWRDVGRTTHTGEDAAFYLDAAAAHTAGIERDCVPLVIGDAVRDHALTDADRVSLLPYDARSAAVLDRLPAHVGRWLWPLRATLRGRRDFGQSPEERGLPWYAHSMFFRERFRTPLSITFGEVATHNHFVLDRGGKVFKQTAPVIKLAPEATESDHLRLLGPLNSSAGCFWMKQVFFNKGLGGIGGGIGDEAWELRYAHDGSKLARFPLPPEAPLEIARCLDARAQEAAALAPAALCARVVPSREGLGGARARWESVRRRMVGLQEELDWRCYRLYGLLDADLTLPEPTAAPEVALGERAFEVVLARRVAAGEAETAWFTRHGARPLTEVPAHLALEYRELVERRIAVIESSRAIGLLERPEYKRRWAHESWEKQEAAALRGWLLDRMEAPELWESDPAALQSVGRLADRLRGDADFMGVLALYAGRPDVDLTAAVAELVGAEAVPYLAALRHTPAGMAKRAEWERVWDRQRAEDAIDARTELSEDDPRRLSEGSARALKQREVGTIAPPPRYVTTDFRAPALWRLRGKLDVPKERFISYPGAERAADPTPVIGWAGWDHRQRAVALASYVVRAQDDEGFAPERLAPLLAGLAELLPWLRQWHDAPDASGVRFGEFVRELLEDRARRAGLGVEALGGWRPAEAPARRRRRAGAGGRGRARIGADDAAS